METSLKVELIDIDEIVPYEGNAKLHPHEQIEQIAKSIEEFGMCDPVGVWHDADGAPVIVEGHGRVLALRLLGASRVPVVYLDHLDDAGRRMYGIVHNKVTMNSGLDFNILAADLGELGGMDMAALGFESEVASLDISGMFDSDGDGDAAASGGGKQPREVVCARCGETFSV